MTMGLLPDTLNCGLRMRRECRERFPWCMSGSITRGGGENVPGIPGACAIHYFMYLTRAPLSQTYKGNFGDDRTMYLLGKGWRPSKRESDLLLNGRNVLCYIVMLANIGLHQRVLAPYLHTWKWPCIHPFLRVIMIACFVFFSFTYLLLRQHTFHVPINCFHTLGTNVFPIALLCR